MKRRDNREVVLARKGQNWTIASRNNQPANSEEVRRLLDTLNQEQVTQFVADTASGSAEIRTRPTAAAIDFQLFRLGKHGRNSRRRTSFPDSVFRKTEGDEVYARVGEEPFIVAVNQDLLDKIWTDPLQWQELAIFQFKPDEIHRLARVTDREESLVRSGAKDWKWIKGDGAIDTIERAIAPEYARYVARRALGRRDRDRARFRQAQLTITFTTSPDDKTVHKLMIGQPSEEGMWFAHMDGHDGTFVLSNPDFTALKLSFARNAGPSPAPGATQVPSAVSSPVTAPSPGD